MASKRRNMFQKNKTQETTENAWAPGFTYNALHDIGDLRDHVSTTTSRTLLDVILPFMSSEVHGYNWARILLVYQKDGCESLSGKNTCKLMMETLVEHLKAEGIHYNAYDMSKNALSLRENLLNEISTLLIDSPNSHILSNFGHLYPLSRWNDSKPVCFPYASRLVRHDLNANVFARDVATNGPTHPRKRFELQVMKIHPKMGYPQMRRCQGNMCEEEFVKKRRRWICHLVDELGSVVSCFEFVGPNRFRLIAIFRGATTVMKVHGKNTNYDQDSSAEDGDWPKPVRTNGLKARDDRPCRLDALWFVSNHTLHSKPNDPTV
ncbi:hypothetical protein AAG570_002905 [Ranatra chinensis]|uniref:Uncharacterized protein n=1 Tax=Ranatra chinensis TaxID=642074 RepID=A0ABD0Y5A2_9HEMI